MITPLVSIIVPVYNRFNIKGTIDSILAQDYPNLEIIIVNDGSSEKNSMALESLINKYDNSRIIYLYQENKGPSAARNFGLKHSNGTYVCFFDSDDIMLPYRISHQVRSMLQDNSDFCLAGFHYRKRDLDIIPNLKVKNNGLHSFLLLQDNIFVGTQGWIFKKNMLVKINGYNEKMWTYEDCDLVFRYFIQIGTKLSIVPEVLTIYCDDDADDRLTNLKKTKDFHFLYGAITFYSNVVEYILSSNLNNKNKYLNIHYKKILKITAYYHKEMKKNTLLNRIQFLNSRIKLYDNTYYYLNRIYYYICQCYYMLKKYTNEK